MYKSTYKKNFLKNNNNLLKNESNFIDINYLWEEIKPQLKDHLGNGTFKSWISPLVPKEFVSGCFILSSPTRFIRDWLKNNCEKKILEFLKLKESNILSIDIIFSSTENIIPNKKNINSNSHESLKIDEKKNNILLKKNSFLTINLNPHMNFNNFIVGKSNELAYAAAKKVSENSNIIFNPLFIYGSTGIGKTHLLHAIASNIKKKEPHKEVIYLSAEKFMYLFIKSLRFHNAVSFKEQFRSVDVLIIDDLQFIIGKDSTQEEFLHTFNALIEQKSQVIISADKSPFNLEGIEEKLKSRLSWGLLADINETNYELRLKILESKIESLQIQIPAKVLYFLADNINSNVRELEGAITRIAAYSTLIGRKIDLTMTKDILKDFLYSKEKLISIEEIQKKVSNYYNICNTEMYSKKKKTFISKSTSSSYVSF